MHEPMRVSVNFAFVESPALPVLVVETASENFRPGYSASDPFPAGLIANDLHRSTIGTGFIRVNYMRLAVAFH